MMYSHEERLKAGGCGRIAGIDEAGRGPLAGPVVAAAVVLPDEQRIEGLKDSKKLSQKKREALFEEITEKAEVGIGIVSEQIIDKINIYQASLLAMKKAVYDLLVMPNYLLIDGNMRLKIPVASESIIRGDQTCACIAAASIIAKVTRDRIMVKLHERYSQYSFDKHKGYPTQEHISLLNRFGVSPVHRNSFGPVKDTLLSHGNKTI